METSLSNIVTWLGKFYHFRFRFKKNRSKVEQDVAVEIRGKTNGDFIVEHSDMA